MCIGAPKVPAPQPIPDRRASVLPDGGDPSVALDARRRRALLPSLMVFSNQGTLGAPSIGSASTSNLGT
jgi:hypothetical protein